MQSLSLLSGLAPAQVSTVRMQGVILLLFAKYYHLPFLRDVQTDCTRTGLGGYWVSTGQPGRLEWESSPQRGQNVAESRAEICMHPNVCKHPRPVS